MNTKQGNTNRSIHYSNTKNRLAFTLLELCISMAITALLLGLVAPNIEFLIKHAKMTSEINQISTIIRFARTSAINTFENVSVCSSANFFDCESDWQHPIIVFIDKNNNKRRDSNEILLASKAKLDLSQKLKGPKKLIVFRESGDNASPTSLILCPTNNEVKYARAIFISLQGRIRLSVDSDDDGIHEIAKKHNIDCQLF